MLSAEQIEGYRLSFQQEDQWSLQQWRSAARFGLQCAITVEGRLDLKVLSSAVQRLLQRHEILRTIFYRLPEMALPLQVIIDSDSISLAVRDLSQFDLPSQITQQEVLWHQISEYSIDWENGPLVNLWVIRLGGNRHQLFLELSTLCADRLTLEHFIRELGSDYEGSLSLARETLQYADFAEWQHQLLACESNNAIKFWRTQVPFDPLITKLPFKIRAEVSSEFAPDWSAVTLSEGLRGEIQSLVENHQLSLELFFLTAWMTLLHRHSGHTDLLIGVSSDCRNEYAKEAIGPYERFLPLRFTWNKEHSFLQTVRRLQNALKTTRAWKDYFSWLIFSDSVRRPAYLPFTFGYERKLGSYQGKSISLRIDKLRVCTGQFKLNLLCTELEKSFSLSIHYDAAAFSSDIIACISDQLAALAESIIEQPERPLGRLSMLSEIAHRKVVFDYNQNRLDYPYHLCLHQLFEAQAEKTPNAMAIAFSGNYLNYAELNRGANRLANYLRARGIRPNTLVGLYLDRCPEMVMGILGILKAGAAYVPIDPSYPESRIVHVLRDAAITLVLSREGLRQNFPCTSQEIICLDDEQKALARCSEATPTALSRSDDLGYVIYTSGSTGLPKGVAISHRNGVHSTYSRLKYYHQSVKNFLLLSSFAFDSSVAGIFWTLSQGGCLCLPKDEELEDAAALASLIEREHISHVLSLPSLYQLLIEQFDGRNIASLATVIVAGEWCRGDLAAEHHKHLGGVKLFNEYGPTEGTVWSSVYESFPSESDESLPIGKPIGNTKIYLLDDALNPVPTGVPGQVYIGGDGLAMGYLNRPELTAEKFIPNLFADSPGERLYQTGDIARFRPDGNIEFLGRADQQVKLRGYRIELGEIEARLHGHPKVRDVAVLLREENGRNGRLIAYVVGQQERLQEQASLRNYLETVLPDYMIPSAFVFLPVLPLTPNGKTDHQALLSMDLAVQSVASYQPPSTKKEKILVSIWKDMLRLERPGIRDSFFDLGGDSLLSIQMVSRARQAGISLTPRQVFQHKTIEALAAISESSVVRELEEEVVSGQVPLTPIQRWFFSKDFPNPGLWTHSLLMELKRPMDGALLEIAVASLITHHDALRMRFTKENDGWRQVNLPEMLQPPFQEISLSHIPQSDQKKMLEALAKEAESIAVEGGLLFRIILFDLGEKHPDHLLIVTHHLVADGLSWRILLEDLQTAYQQLSEGKEIILPQKTASFQRWSQALLEYAGSGRVLEEVDFWKGWLNNENASFPVDNTGGSQREAASETLYFNLSAEETQKLIQQAPVLWQCSIDDLLLTALTLTLNYWSGMRRFLVDRDQHGREQFLDGIDVSRTVGWFTSLSPVLLEVPSENSPAQALLSVREQLSEIPYKGFHYGLLRYLSSGSSISREIKKLPSAQLIFNYLGQIDQTFPDSPLFVMAEERIRKGFDPDWQRPYEMAIDTYVLSSRLHLAWEYSNERYQRATIEQLGQGFVKVLQEFILPLAELE